jgi:hypothetical protein
MSVAPNPADLFSANPQLAVTVPITIAVTAGDTTTVNVAPDLFQSGSGEAVPTLYFQTRGTLRGAAGGTAVGPADVLSLGVNLILTVTVNDTTP